MGIVKFLVELNAGFLYEYLNYLHIFTITCGIILFFYKREKVSVLFLIGLFLSISSNLILPKISFIVLTFLLAYVGAFSILFLFLTNINEKSFYKNKIFYINYLGETYILILIYYGLLGAAFIIFIKLRLSVEINNIELYNIYYIICIVHVISMFFGFCGLFYTIYYMFYLGIYYLDKEYCLYSYRLYLNNVESRRLPVINNIYVFTNIYSKIYLHVSKNNTILLILL